MLQTLIICRSGSCFIMQGNSCTEKQSERQNSREGEEKKVKKENREKRMNSGFFEASEEKLLRNWWKELFVWVGGPIQSSSWELAPEPTEELLLGACKPEDVLNPQIRPGREGGRHNRKAAKSKSQSLEMCWEWDRVWRKAEVPWALTPCPTGGVGQVWAKESRHRKMPTLPQPRQNCWALWVPEANEPLITEEQSLPLCPVVGLYYSSIFLYFKDVVKCGI